MTLNTNLPDPHKRLYQHAEVVVPSDVADLPHPAAALYVGDIVGGDRVAVVTGGDEIVNINGVRAGQIIPFRATKVLSDTTAASILALW